ncbi:MAG: cbb3-type cytochrome c oxidase N-terminal domain-containing protein [Cyclobacteriaceae bacterium]|nr:c-type cytochrome [Cyclobacteriaceae bacterium]
MKKYMISGVLTFLSIGSYAQDNNGSISALLQDPLILFYITAGFLFVVSLLVIAVALYMLQVLRHMARNAAMERAEKLGIEYKEEPSLWAKFDKWTTDAVPIEKEATVMLDHNYDGIRELDNHLPPWWKWLLYGTIIWAVFYMIAYHVTNSLPLSIQEYDNEVAYAEEQVRKLQAANPGAQIDESTVQLVTDAVALSDGKSTFNNICASCHRPDGGGDIGPNLTDQYWKHGGSIQDIFKVVKNGVPNTNMVAWGGALSPEKMQNVASYVLSLQGSNPANGKAPEGDLFVPKAEEKVASDSLKTQASL